MRTLAQPRARTAHLIAATAALVVLAGSTRGTDAGAAEPVIRTVASTGGRFLALESAPSLNDHDHVAFVGLLDGPKGPSHVLCSWLNGPTTDLLAPVLTYPREGDPPTQFFGSVQIDNNDQIYAYRALFAQVRQMGTLAFIPYIGDLMTCPLTYWEAWSVYGRNAEGLRLPNRQVAVNGGILAGQPILEIPPQGTWGFPQWYFFNPVWAGRYASPFAVNSIYALRGPGSFNNRGQGVFGGFDSNSRNLLYNHNRQVIGTSPEARLPVMVADDGHVVFRSSPQAITLGTVNAASGPNIASGFQDLSVPGISDDGEAVTFAGRLPASLAESLNGLQQGAAPVTTSPGVFLYLPSQPFYLQVCGENGNGVLDAGETWRDTNGNGTVDRGEDTGPVARVSGSERVCVNRLRTGDAQYRIAFVGTPADGIHRESLFVADVQVAGNRAHLVAGPAAVFGTPDSIRLHDSVNARGSLCFWAGRTNGFQAIHLLSADPPRPFVVNVITHGFDPGRWSGTEHAAAFMRDFETIATEFKQMAGPGSPYEGRVFNLVPRWDSSLGFLSAGAAAATAHVVPEPRVQAVALLALDWTSRLSRESASSAAGDIRSQLARLIPAIEDDVDGTALIHLVGHSRGGAVNAMLARLLIADGHEVSQYTALDGFGTEWPEPGGWIGDCHIEGLLQGSPIPRRVNYRAEKPLGPVALGWLPESARAFLDRLLEVLPDAPNPGPEAIQHLLGIVFADNRAPERAGFENVVIPGTTHMDITQVYADSATVTGPRYIRDNLLGRATGPGPVLNEVGPPGRRLALSGTAPTTVRGLGISSAISDGNLEAVGRILELARSIDGTGVEDAGASFYLRALANPRALLTLGWNPTGQCELVKESGSWRLAMTQGTNEASVSRAVYRDPTVSGVEFLLTTAHAGPGDQLSVRLDDTPLRTIDLKSATNGVYRVNLRSVVEGQRLAFHLTGPLDDPARLTLDDIRLVRGGELRIVGRRIVDGQFRCTLATGTAGVHILERRANGGEWEDVVRAECEEGTWYEFADAWSPARGHVLYRVRREGP